jgi:hypothetical protein
MHVRQFVRPVLGQQDVCTVCHTVSISCCIMPYCKSRCLWLLVYLGHPLYQHQDTIIVGRNSSGTIQQQQKQHY